MPRRNPYAGRRKLAASRRDIDEDRVIRRYAQTGNLTQTAREAGIAVATVRAILDRNEVPVRTKAKPDDDAVLRCYERTRATHVTAIMLGTDWQHVTDVLDRHSVLHSESGWHRASNKRWKDADG